MGKDRTTGSPNISEIDDDVSDVVGKRVYYFLLNEEGGMDEPVGRKRPAVINRVYTDNRRDEQGRKVSGLFVFEGSGFSKDAPLSSGREAGTWDIFKSGDSVS